MKKILLFIVCSFLIDNLQAQFADGITIVDSIYAISAMDLGDIDLDGNVDILISYSNIQSDDFFGWAPGSGDGSFGSIQLITDTCRFRTSKLADLDLDGDLDIISFCENDNRLHFFINNGNASFTGLSPTYFYWAEPIHTEIFVEDVDLDGDMDIIYVDEDNNLACWIEQTSLWEFSDKIVIGTAYRALDVADLDFDGDVDVIGADDHVEIFLNDGNGNFSSDQIFNGTPNCYSVRAGDIDNDNLLDVIFEYYTPNGSLLWSKNLGNGNWSTPDTIPWEVEQTDYMRLMDVDQNGTLDIVLVGGEQNFPPNKLVRWYSNDGGGNFIHQIGVSQAWTTTDYYRYFFLEDIDNDSDKDIVVISPDFDYIKWYENLNTHPFWVSGNVFHDLNSNGQLDMGEPGIDVGQLSISPDSLYSVTSQGNFTISLDTGIYVLEYLPTPTPYWQLTTPPSYNFQLTMQDTSETDLNFGLAPALDTTYLVSSLFSPVTRCNWPIQQILTVHNQGTATASGYVELTMDPLITFNSAVPPPDSIVGNNYYWSFSNLAPLNNFDVLLNITMPGTNWIGTILQNTISTYYVAQNSDLTQSTVTDWSSELVCSYDPNDKQVSPVGVGQAYAIDIETEYLTYTVRFQNTGTDTAFNVVIRDQLSDLLDWSSLQILSHSHPMTTLIESDGEAVFKFQNILLPDSNINEPTSHGYVMYRINISDDALLGDSILNTAWIYFDYNPPIITNTVLNTLQNDVGFPDYSNTYQRDMITVQPNPFNETTTLIFNERLIQNSWISVVDIHGRELRSIPVYGQQVEFSKDGLANGIYTIILTEGSELKGTTRIVIF